MSNNTQSSPRWTDEQDRAIRTAGKNLLVSAAAGSGKTSVLAERCVHLVCDPAHRCNITQLLVVTFTEAAAAEMKARIEKNLRERRTDSATQPVGWLSPTTSPGGAPDHSPGRKPWVNGPGEPSPEGATECSPGRKPRVNGPGEPSPGGAPDHSPGRKPWVNGPGEPSPEGATECSPGRKPRVNGPGEPSPEGATECSPGRKPWVDATVAPSPGGAKEPVAHESLAPAKLSTRSASAAPAPTRDEHLSRQLALLEHASICTLHSFCLRLLRQHFHRVGLDPDFRVLDADEAMLLRMEIARDVFMERYDRDDAAAFHAFVDAFGEGKDEPLIALVVRTFEMLRSLLEPNQWMREAKRRLEEAAEAPLESSQLGRQYLQFVRERLADLRRDCQAAVQSLSRMSGFSSYVNYVKQLATIANEWSMLLDRGGYDTVATDARNLQLPRLPTIPNSASGKEAAKALVETVQKQFKEGRLIESLRFSADEWREGVRSIVPHAKVFLDLIEEYARRYRREKDQQRALDFADLERFALQLLAEGPISKLRPSAVARSLHQQFQHVLVDEYQDINELQDAILALVSHECVQPTRTPNLFCVGDVKQSIYGFRLAEPTRFIQRDERYRNDGATGEVIDLQANFRSRPPLIDVLNKVFERLMTKAAADIEYDHSHRLVARANYADGQNLPVLPGAPVELHLLPDRIEATGDGESGEELDLERSEREAMLVAQRIGELMGRGERPRMNVFDRSLSGYRPIEYRDIVILLRAQRYHADAYADALRDAGIPVHNSGGTGYFDAMEVRDILSILRLLDNQQQDIPMAAVLRSPLSGLPQPEDVLARIRLAYPGADRPLPFHEAVVRYAKERDDELAAKLRDFLADLADWRKLARQRPIADVIWTIYEKTGFLAFCNGLADGQRRCANLIALYERARQFGTFSRQGLYRFNRFLESLRQEADAPLASDLSEAENVVRIMTIHKSKGLEFPVVILPEMGKRINMQGCGDNIVADRHAYLGLTAIDQRKRIRYPSLSWMLVSERLRRQTLAEELRVLYVGMTRAKEHLILVGTCKSTQAESWSRRWDLHDGPLPASTILSANSMLDWLGPVSAMLLADGGQSIQVYEHPGEAIQAWAEQTQAQKQSPERSSRLAMLQPLSPAPPEHPAAEQVKKRLAWAYPHQPFCSLRASQPVTTLAKGTSPETAASSPRSASPKPLPAELPKPKCLLEEGKLSPADRGTAVHLFLEHLDFSRKWTDAQLSHQRDSLLARKLLTPAQAAAINLADIRWFLDSDLGQLLRRRCADLRPELPLNYAAAPTEFITAASPDPRDQVMLRGRIDLLVSDEKGFILIDYKTDDIDEPTIAQRTELYRAQLDYYRRAIQKITSRPVHTAHLAFLTARHIVTLAD